MDQERGLRALYPYARRGAPPRGLFGPLRRAVRCRSDGKVQDPSAEVFTVG